jgi:hypothetical protein
VGTRLLSEHMIKNRFPHLRYVRIHTNGINRATIYAWDENLFLQDYEIGRLNQYAADYLYPYVCFNVKPYNMVLNDKVPQVHDLPDLIIRTAMNRSLNQSGILTAINRLFCCGRLIFNRYEPITGCIHFEFRSTVRVNESDKGLISSYLYEILPLGSNCEVAFD